MVLAADSDDVIAVRFDDVDDDDAMMSELAHYRNCRTITTVLMSLQNASSVNINDCRLDASSNAGAL